jgi:O-antigen/teichoic acid export membrane protein
MTIYFWPKMDTLRGKLLKHSLLLSSGAAASAVFAYLFRITCARNMPVEDYGRLALFLIIYSNLIILACFNLGISVTKYASEYKIKDENKIPSLYLSASTIAIITSFLAFIVSMIVYGRYNILSLPITTCLFFSFFFNATHWVNMGILQGFQKMGWAGILQATLNQSKFVLLIIFAAMLHRLSIESALLAYFMGIYVTSTLSFFLILRILKVKWTPLRDALSVLKRRINRSTIKLIVSFSGYTVLRDLLSTSLTALIPALILSRTNFADVAYLDITLMLYSVLTLFLSSLRSRIC